LVIIAPTGFGLSRWPFSGISRRVQLMRQVTWRRV